MSMYKNKILISIILQFYYNHKGAKMDSKLKEINKKLSMLIDMIGVEKRWMNTTEVSHYTGYTEQGIYKMVKSGEFKRGIHYHKKIKKLIFNKKEIDNWIESDEPVNNCNFNIDKTIEDILSDIA